MRFSIVAIASAVATTAVLAAPTLFSKRDVDSDVAILNYALSLEYLEDAFYTWGLNKYDKDDFKKAGYDSVVRERFVHIGEHEAEHVRVLKSVITSLKGTPIPKSRALENTGVSAYLGVAAGLEGDLLTAAASITTVEARHSSFLNEVLGRTGAPYAFDTPLTVREVVTIAANFVESCPFEIPVSPFKKLNAKLPIKRGEKVEVSYKDEDPTKQTWCQFLYNDKVRVSPRRECILPKGVNGYVYVVVTDTATPISLKDDSHILAGPALLFLGDH
ncbi:hypothetical protein BGX34_002151 [Mortierella sp. NVP85]|nr:hypothetical protein BGX34_002151 [Mortierella sp. NVP85]